MLLELHTIARMYGTRCIFKNVSLRLSAASLTLLVGANGAGKSTLMHIMAGLARPSAGTVTHGVQPAEIGYLGHATFLYPALTAVENLRFWASLYGAPVTASAIEAVLARVELHKYAHERAGVFSRGMAQRLNVARVLLLQPRLWLLDEPATGLDAASSLMLRREILAARAGGAAVVWISHDVQNDAPLADRLLALQGKRLAYDGSPKDYSDSLLASPPEAVLGEGPQPSQAGAAAPQGGGTT